MGVAATTALAGLGLKSIVKSKTFIISSFVSSEPTRQAEISYAVFCLKKKKKKKKKEEKKEEMKKAERVVARSTRQGK